MKYWISLGPGASLAWSPKLDQGMLNLGGLQNLKESNKEVGDVLDPMCVVHNGL